MIDVADGADGRNAQNWYYHIAKSSDEPDVRIRPNASCAWYYHAAWQGSSLRAPVASPRPWLFMGIEPISEPSDRIAGQTLAGDFALPAPIDAFSRIGGYRAP